MDKAERRKIRKQFWRITWRRALLLMPYRIRHYTTEEWVPCKMGSLPLREYAEGIRDGTIDTRNGVHYRLIVHECTQQYGQITALAKIMYPKIKKWPHLTVRRNMEEGYAPKGGDRQALLMRIADDLTDPIELLKDLGFRTDLYEGQGVTEEELDNVV